MRTTRASADVRMRPINPYSRGFVCVAASSEHVLFHTVFMAPRGTVHTTRVRAHTGARLSSAALLGLVVMCFMSAFCCGCVSQAGRLTNCSVLLNVIVMEAVNGSELIALTHLATCYCVLQFKTPCPGDLVLSRCF